MMRTKLNNSTQAGFALVGGLILLFFYGCTNDQVKETFGSDKPSVIGVLNLSSLPIGSKTEHTRVSGESMEVWFGDSLKCTTRSIDEEAVDNVCVFQFEGSLSSGNAILKSQAYFSNLTGMKLNVPFVESSEFFVYVCANLGNLTSRFEVNGSTYKDFIDASYLVSNQSDFASLLPMGGTSTATYDTSSLPENISVDLLHLVAKVSFTYDLTLLPDGDSFTVTDLSLRNVPRNIPCVIPASQIINMDLTDYSGMVPESPQLSYTNTWYMGQNLRGIGGTDGGNSVASWTDRTSDNAPSGSTYIELRGNYVTGGEIYAATYVLYLGNGTDMNDYNVIANHSYTVTAKIRGINTADHRVTFVTNLSSDETANCYIVSESDKDYSFNGTVRGNGCTTDYAKAQYSDLSGGEMFPTVLPNASDAVNIPKADISDAVIVWQTATGLLSNVRWDSFTGQVKFTTGSVVNGNAVIAVRDSEGKILWSWHIWRTDGITLDDMVNNAISMETNVESHTWYTVGGSNAERKIMDRNLGALSTDGSGNIGAGSLMYQFGRKDPFVGAANYTSSNTEQLVYDSLGNPFRFSDSDKLKNVSTAGSNAKVVIDYSIQHPESFIKGSSSSSYNWLPVTGSNTAAWKVSNCLWGDNNISADCVDPAPWDGEKTIYDPCPVGWRVASADVWTGVLNTLAGGWKGQSVSNSASNQVYHTNSWTTAYASPYGHTFYFNDDTGTAIFYPASGCRAAETGALYGIGYLGYGWLSSPGGGSSLYRVGLTFSTSVIHVAYEDYCANSFSVRCVRE